jgi:hypothetical protein
MALLARLAVPTRCFVSVLRLPESFGEELSEQELSPGIALFRQRSGNLLRASMVPHAESGVGCRCLTCSRREEQQPENDPRNERIAGLLG